MIVTKTINPLHFEDLDPRRFEDLIRQLIYDFKLWAEIEATGRSGSEKGFDVRAWEKVYEEDEADKEIDEEDNLTKESSISIKKRLWLIQCKREKTVTPSKIKKYADEIINAKHTGLYGVLFVAPCSLSKETRDKFKAALGKAGVQEIYLWSNSELEDIFIQPKNDHLFFAYTGTSLLTRQRTIKSLLKSKLSTKRKVINNVCPIEPDVKAVALFRDINDKEYPAEHKIKDFKKNCPWKAFYIIGHYYNGIIVLLREYHAYIEWSPNQDKRDCPNDISKRDFFEDRDFARPHNDQWLIANAQAPEIWFNTDDDKKGTLQILGYLPYEQIIEIDPFGDNVFKEPHIFVNFNKGGIPFEGNRSRIKPMGLGYSYITKLDKSKRTNYFKNNTKGTKKKNKVSSS